MNPLAVFFLSALVLAVTRPLLASTDLQASASTAATRTFRILCTVGTYSDLKYDLLPDHDPQAISIGRRLSGDYPCPAGTTLALYRELPVPAGSPPGTKPVKVIVTTAPLPARQLKTLVVVAPIVDHTLRATSLDDDPEKHPAGTLRLINLSRYPIAAAINQSSSTTAASQATVVPFGPGGLLIQIAVQKSSKWISVFHKERLIAPNRRSYAFVFDYQNDPELPDEIPPPPALVRFFNETATPPITPTIARRS